MRPGDDHRGVSLSFGGGANMSHLRTEYSCTAFVCSIVDRTVNIHRAFEILADQEERLSARTMVKIECSKMNTCPIATHDGAGTSVDWSRCAFFKTPPEGVSGASV